MLTLDQKQNLANILRSYRESVSVELQLHFQLTPILGGRRNLALAASALERGREWMGMGLSFLDAAYPYPESRNPSNDRVEPTADVSAEAYTLPTHDENNVIYTNIGLVKLARQRAATLADNLREVLAIVPDDEMHKGVRLHSVLEAAWRYLKEYSFSLGNLLPELANEASFTQTIDQVAQATPRVQEGKPVRTDEYELPAENEKEEIVTTRARLLELFGHLLPQADRDQIASSEFAADEVLSRMGAVLDKFTHPDSAIEAAQASGPYTLHWDTTPGVVKLVPDENGSIYLLGLVNTSADGTVAFTPIGNQPYVAGIDPYEGAQGEPELGSPAAIVAPTTPFSNLDMQWNSHPNPNPDQQEVTDAPATSTPPPLTVSDLVAESSPVSDAAAPAPTNEIPAASATAESSPPNDSKNSDENSEPASAGKPKKTTGKNAKKDESTEPVKSTDTEEF